MQVGKFKIPIPGNDTFPTPLKREESEFIIAKDEPDVPADLLRLFVKTGEYIFVHANDILMIESNDHFVKLYIAVKESYKMILRHATFKDFLALLPSILFLRLNRFCAVNVSRLTAGNCNEQYFEFDFRIIIKPTYPITPSLLSKIGK